MITYVKVVWDLPPGLEVAQRRSSRRHINGSVGKQSPTRRKRRSIVWTGMALSRNL
jgi:hypothetical protein